MIAKIFPVWITKYALSQGIYEATAEIVSETMIKVTEVEEHPFYHGKDWYFSEQAALIDFERRRMAKIDSLKKALRKLETLTPTIKKLGENE